MSKAKVPTSKTKAPVSQKTTEDKELDKLLGL
jgi:hypothetical protein